MSKENKENITFWEKAQQSFKVLILDEETFQEIDSYKLSRLNVYTMLSVLFIGMATLILSLFFLYSCS